MKKIKYLLYISFISFLMVGCDTNTPDKYENKSENGITYKVMIIDGCEYIWYKDKLQYGQTMTHKGNCKNH